MSLIHELRRFSLWLSIRFVFYASMLLVAIFPLQICVAWIYNVNYYLPDSNDIGNSATLFVTGILTVPLGFFLIKRIGWLRNMLYKEHKEASQLYGWRRVLDYIIRIILMIVPSFLIMVVVLDYEHVKVTTTCLTGFYAARFMCWANSESR